MAERPERPAAEHPAWWNEYHESAWERVKEALRRDWEQTKADLTRGAGQELHQGLVDTLRQALGRERLPLFTSEPTEHPLDDHWYRTEHAVRYGYGAYSQYEAHEEWSEELEEQLRGEWEDLKTNHAWDAVKGEVRLGWQGGRAEGRRQPPPIPEDARRR